MSPDGIDRDDVAHALDALASEVPAPHADAVSLIARGRRRILRQRLIAVGVALAVIAAAATVGAVASNHDDTRRTVATPTTSTGPSATGKSPSGITVASELEAWKCLSPLQHTIDGGRTWTTVSVPDRNSLENCTASAGGNLWATSTNFTAGTASIIRVRDGTDAEVLPFSPFQKGLRLSSLTFVDADHGWVETYREQAATLQVKLYRTTDGGTSWKLVSTDPAIGQLAFVDAEHGWTMAGNSLRATSDGGVTWRSVELPEPSAAGKRIDSFQIRAHGDWIVVRRGVLISGSRYHPFFDFSSDGGRTWELRAGPEEFELPGVGNNAFDAFDSRGWVLTSGKSLRVTTDAERWETRPDVAKINTVMRIYFPSPEVGWAMSEGGSIFRTADGARTWTNVTDGAAPGATTTTTTPHPGSAGLPVQLAFASGTEGWICGDRPQYTTDDFNPFGAGAKPVVVPPRAVDPGDDFPQQPLCTSAPGGNFWMVRESADRNASEIVHVTMRPTGDETSVSPFVTVPFGRIEALDFVDAKHGWALVTHESARVRTLYTTEDGGVTWSNGQDAPIRSSLEFADTTHGWSISNNDPRTLAATTDGGRTWHEVEAHVPRAANPPHESIVSRVFVNGDTIVAYGHITTGDNFILVFVVSTDGGRTWDERSAPEGVALPATTDFSAADADHWALGFRNYLYVTDDGGRTWTDQEQFAGIDEISYVARPSANAMFVSGYGDAAQTSAVVLGTINGGENWTTVDFSAPPTVGSGQAVNWPGGIVGCPTRTITPSAGDPPPGLVDAAFAYIRAQGFWEPDTASAVYKVGDQHSGEFGALFNYQLRSCPAASVANAWVVELNAKPGSGGGGSTPQAQLALAHYADGWHVFGRYH